MWSPVGMVVLFLLVVCIAAFLLVPRSSPEHVEEEEAKSVEKESPEEMKRNLEAYKKEARAYHDKNSDELWEQNSTMKVPTDQEK